MPRFRTSPARHSAGFTLLEVMIGLSLFVIAGLGVMEVIGLINQNSTVNRALTAGRMLVEAKIAKAQTDTYTPNNGVVPLSCQVPLAANAPYANQDTTVVDPFDSSPNAENTNSNKFKWSQDHLEILVDSPDINAVILGTMTQTVSTFEATSKTLLITFTLNFTCRGKAYTITQSTVRAPDQI